MQRGFYHGLLAAGGAVISAWSPAWSAGVIVPNQDVIEVAVERPAVGGRMIARHEGRIVLVSGAIPGERVRSLVERRARGVLLVRTVEVIESSPDRRDLAGDPACGGRSFAHIAYRRQLALKAEIILDGFRRIGRIDLADPPPVAASPETGYRMRARLHVGDGRVGFLAEGSHRVCDLRGTGQLPAATERLVGRLVPCADVLQSAGTRRLELAENLTGAQCALHAVVDGDPEAAAGLLRVVADTSGLTGFSVSSAARAGRSCTVAGAPQVSDAVAAFLPSPGAGSLALQRHPAAFFQANRYLVPALVSVVDRLAAGDQVLDLYAGTGLFAVSIAAARGGRVTAVERDPTGARDLAANAGPLSTAIRVVRAPVETYLKRTASLAGAAVIVDPPRAGLSREVVTRLARGRPDRIVYVSCDVATQARDLRALTASGYRLDQLHAFDMFPNTPHIETVASLERG